MEQQKPILTAQNREELNGRGYTVVTGVVTNEECDGYKEQYCDWLRQFGAGKWPFSRHSLIQRYGVAHLEASWRVRLHSRPVFAQLWGTDHLLSSLDAIAIGRPPEDGEEAWWEEGQHWLHCDQSAARKGCHAYQGAVYLEQADEDDWTLLVLERSHVLHEEFFENRFKAKVRSVTNDIYPLRDEDYEWYVEEKGCQAKRVTVPKGAMVLWDSRLIHANARPRKGRSLPRWRFVVFVCMGPAAWSTPRDLEVKRHAYRDKLMTTHWPCDDVKFMMDPARSSGARERYEVTTLPEVAKTDVARRLMGDLPYGDPDDPAPPRPEWSKDVNLGKVTISQRKVGVIPRGFLWSVGVILLGVFIAFVYTSSS